MPSPVPSALQMRPHLGSQSGISLRSSSVVRHLQCREEGPMRGLHQGAELDFLGLPHSRQCWVHRPCSSLQQPATQGPHVYPSDDLRRPRGSTEVASGMNGPACLGFSVFLLPCGLYWAQGDLGRPLGFWSAGDATVLPVGECDRPVPLKVPFRRDAVSHWPGPLGPLSQQTQVCSPARPLTHCAATSPLNLRFPK